MASRVAGSLWTPRLVWAVNVIGGIEGRAETLGMNNKVSYRRPCRRPVSGPTRR